MYIACYRDFKREVYKQFTGENTMRMNLKIRLKDAYLSNKSYYSGKDWKPMG